MRCRPHNCSKKNGIKTTFHKWDENHLSCKRDFCPCQNSNSSGLSLYPPQCLGFGIKLLQRKKKLFQISLDKNKNIFISISPMVVLYIGQFSLRWWWVGKELNILTFVMNSQMINPRKGLKKCKVIAKSCTYGIQAYSIPFYSETGKGLPSEGFRSSVFSRILAQPKVSRVRITKKKKLTLLQQTPTPGSAAKRRKKKNLPIRKFFLQLFILLMQNMPSRYYGTLKKAR